MIAHLADPSTAGAALCGVRMVKLHPTSAHKTICTDCYPIRQEPVWPKRPAGAYCGTCGMSVGHWSGCTKGE